MSQQNAMTTISVVSLEGSTLVGPVVVGPDIRIAGIALEASRALGARCTLAYGTEVLKWTHTFADYQVDEGAVLVAIIACVRIHVVAYRSVRLPQ